MAEITFGCLRNKMYRYCAHELKQELTSLIREFCETYKGKER